MYTSRIFFFVIIMIVLAIIIVVISFLAYNKRLEKISNGELRDTHSKLPEPGPTAGVTYKTVLICLTIIAVLSISTMIGQINSMSSNLSSMQSKLYNIDMELLELQRKVEENGRLTTDFYWEITDQNMEKKTATLKFSIGLKEYSEDTIVTLALKDQDVMLPRTAPGTFSGQITTNLFENYDQLKVCITDGGITKVETIDFYEYLFWNVLPMGSLECNLNSKDSSGKTKTSGWYRLHYESPDKIQSVTVRYLVDGKEVKTLDATTQAKNYEQINLDEEYTFERDLSLLVETLTTDGYRIVEKSYLSSRTSADFEDDDYERIYDGNGNLVWENEKYK
ncbi:MAG: hypothetical protein IKS85_00665 [Lachnospiraceae bacterium]|nr:hypothetical protein [Lachnospiraceae bacterium]